jgi:hypothetical protein
MGKYKDKRTAILSLRHAAYRIYVLGASPPPAGTGLSAPIPRPLRGRGIPLLSLARATPLSCRAPRGNLMDAAPCTEFRGMPRNSAKPQRPGVAVRHPCRLRGLVSFGASRQNTENLSPRRPPCRRNFLLPCSLPKTDWG